MSTLQSSAKGPTRGRIHECRSTEHDRNLELSGFGGGYTQVLVMRNIIRTSHDARRRSSGVSGSEPPLQGSPANSRRPSGPPHGFVLPRRASSSVFELSTRRDSGGESLPRINENDSGGQSQGIGRKDSVQVGKAVKSSQLFTRHQSLGVIKFESSPEDKLLLNRRNKKPDTSLRIKKRKIAATLTIIVTFLLFVVLLTIYIKKFVKEFFK